MTTPKLTAEAVLDKLRPTCCLGTDSCSKCDDAALLALLERYTAQVQDETQADTIAASVVAITNVADSLSAWMEKLPLHSAGRKDKSLRAGQMYEAARIVRALAQAPEPTREPARVAPLPPDVVAKLSPGIRATVVRLRSLGFETTDSGDGSNHAAGMEGAMPCPMVAVRVAPSDLITESDRLRASLGDVWDVQGTYDPVDGVAVLIATQAPETKGGE